MFLLHCIVCTQTLGGASFSVALLIVNWPLVSPKIRVLYPLPVIAVATLVLARTFWFLWMFPGSGNANFVFFQTIFFSFCQCYALTESLGAVRRLGAEEAKRRQDECKEEEKLGGKEKTE